MVGAGPNCKGATVEHEGWKVPPALVYYSMAGFQWTAVSFQKCVKPQSLLNSITHVAGGRLAVLSMDFNVGTKGRQGAFSISAARTAVKVT